MIVRPGFFESPARTSGGETQAEMLRHFAGRLGVRLRWVQARRNDQLVPWLRQGRGDIAVHRFSPLGLRKHGLVPSAAVDWVDDLLVASGRDVLGDVGDMKGRDLQVQRSEMRFALAGELDSQTSGPNLIPVPEELTFEEILRRVAGRRYRLSIVDSGLVDAFAGRRDLKIVGPLAETRPVVWGLRPGNSRLKSAVDDFLFAERVLSPREEEVACRDLNGIRKARLLRLVTRNAPTTYKIARGGLGGFEYDLALSFARYLGVRLALRIPPPGKDPLRWLEEGHGDLAALHQPLAPAVSQRFPVTIEYREVDLKLVASSRIDPPAAIEDLAGRRLAADPFTQEIVNLLPVQAPCRFLPTAEDGDALSALIAVEQGEANLAIVDGDTLRLELPDRPGLQEGIVVLPDYGLRWVVNPSAPRLRDKADRFLTRATRSGLVRQLVLADLQRLERSYRRGLPPIPPGHLTPFDSLLRETARRYDVDWRLLASLMYEESRFDPEAIGPGGSAGLFQFMPPTWRELGVQDPTRPEQAIPAAGRYLHQLMAQFADVPVADRVAMALASYNVGPRHVSDARRLAAQMKLSKNRWVDNVETAMVLLDNPDVARRFPAGVCRCRRAVGYTRRILRRYRAYREQFSPVGSPGL